MRWPLLSILSAISFGTVGVSDAAPSFVETGTDTPAPAFEREAWRLVGVPGKSESQFQWLDNGTLAIHSDDAVGFFYHEVMPSTTGLMWRWRVMEAGANSDLRIPGADDRPVAIHLWFPNEEESGSLFGWAASLVGYPSVGRAITYVWGGNEPRGTAFINPHLEDDRGVIVVLQTAATSQTDWVEEQIDFAADYQRHFGSAAPQPTYIAISGDSDDLGGTRAARIDGLRFFDPHGTEEQR